MQVTGRDTTLMRWLKHRGGAQHYQRWGRSESAIRCRAAAVIGADPGTILAAVTPVPDTLSEYQFAGLLRGRKVELVDCKTVPLKVPAQAEIVLEGHVCSTSTVTKAPMAITPVTTIRSSAFPSSACRRLRCGRTQSICSPIPAAHPTVPPSSARR